VSQPRIRSLDPPGRRHRAPTKRGEWSGRRVSPGLIEENLSPLALALDDEYLARLASVEVPTPSPARPNPREQHRERRRQGLCLDCAAPISEHARCRPCHDRMRARWVKRATRRAVPASEPSRATESSLRPGDGRERPSGASAKWRCGSNRPDRQLCDRVAVS
jgi:hypothetical protein